jgi:ketosteroid isomerase-like protein
MVEPVELIDELYGAFARRDGDAMAACYHPDARFSDPVFPDLHGHEVGGMWRMLCARGKDLKIQHTGVWAEDERGGARWEAWYTFSATGRKVHNRIEASFRFADGKIAEHRDDFSLWRWARQALGTPGLLLGWTPIVQGKVRTQARKGLDQFLERDAK